MVHRLETLPEARTLPVGAVLRQAELADALGLAEVLTEAFGEPWSVEKVRAELLENAGVPATFLVELEGRVVATASYQVQEWSGPEAGWVHWVGVSPEARGMALGEIVSHRVILEAERRGNNRVFLTTDDPRLAAIRTYLRLGFEPDLWHESHAERWAAVRRALGD
jgi:mycothiol synthase